MSHMTDVDVRYVNSCYRMLRAYVGSFQSWIYTMGVHVRVSPLCNHYKNVNEGTTTVR